MCHLSYPQLLSCAYSYKYLEVLWLPKRTQLWACFNTEPNRLYRRLRSFPSKLQEYTPPPFSRLSTQYHIDPLLTCFLSLDTSRTSLRLQQSTKFGNRHTAHGLYEYSYNLANSRENWAQKKKSRPGGRGQKFGPGTQRSRQSSKKVFPCLLWLQFSTACKFLYTFDRFCMLQAIKCEGGLGTIASLDRCWCAELRSNGSLMSSKTIRLYKTLEC